MNELRAKEGRLQITASGLRQSHLNLVIVNFDFNPRTEKTQLKYTGDARDRNDLRVDGYDFSFQQRERSAEWYDLWRLYEDAELANEPFPVVSATITKVFRGAPRWTLSLSGELIMTPDSNPHNEHDHTTVDWTGGCRFARVI